MAYCIRGNKSVQTSVRKVALEQIDKAIGEIANEMLDRHEAVHQVRKRCKKLRGLIRLVRPNFADYQQENEYFRDAARELSYVRDAQSIVECFHALIERFGDQIDRDAFAPVRDELVLRRQRIADDKAGLNKRLEKFLSQMHEARGRAARWKVNNDGFVAVAGGLEENFRRGRKALQDAYENPSTESFHEWRKRVKYHWCHARLLRRIWPDLMSVWCATADQLSELLGDVHDLAVFRQTLFDDPKCFGSEADRQVLIGLIDRRRAELQTEARPLGGRLFAGKPKHLRSQFGGYWKSWQVR
jgi:CHAD domain-containing protein